MRIGPVALSFAAFLISTVGVSFAAEPSNPQSSVAVTEASSSKPSSNPSVEAKSRPGEFKPTQKQLEEWNKPIKGFHPIKRVVRPIWKLRREAQELQENIIKLQKPMDGLQPAFESLDKRMAGMESKFGPMVSELEQANDSLGKLSKDVPKIWHLTSDLSLVHHDLQEVVKLHEDIREVSKVKRDIRRMEKQLKDLKQPVTALQKPTEQIVTLLDTQVGATERQLQAVQTNLDSLDSRMVGMGQQLDELKGTVSQTSQPLVSMKSEIAELNSLLRIVVALTAALVTIGALICLVGVALVFKARTGGGRPKLVWTRTGETPLPTKPLARTID